ncbi:hypothetical protein LR48_Vigan03g113100 [Vigna angularis]|uniref:Uncharacterized protein n=1 Tax=Phaseolus angularis TaxID=3914 RepID=A0A0L9U5P4_PHAAN|nr:hypothetical protein LR48_Vigan03g113100 [Vigna angularis]
MTERFTKSNLPIGQITKGKEVTERSLHTILLTTTEHPTVRPSLPHPQDSRLPKPHLPAPLQVACFHLLTSTRMIIARQDGHTTRQHKEHAGYDVRAPRWCSNWNSHQLPPEADHQKPNVLSSLRTRTNTVDGTEKTLVLDQSTNDRVTIRFE